MRPEIVEYLGSFGEIVHGEHLVEIARLSAGDTYGRHTVMQPSIVVDDVDEVRDRRIRYILPICNVQRVERWGCICPACSV